MKPFATSLKLVTTFVLMLATFTGCESTGSGSSSTTVYYGTGFYDPWYYGHYHDHDHDIIVTPPDGRPHPSHPIARPAPICGDATGICTIDSIRLASDASRRRRATVNFLVSTTLSDSDRSTPVEGASKKHPPFFEPVALVLLSLATVGTAWCSFQAATWSGVSQRLMNLSAASGRRAVADQLRSSQMGLLDVMLFSQFINARSDSNETLANFYAERFRGEAKTAFESWIATRPFENPSAPAHPFVTNLYQPRLLAEAELAESESQRLWQEAGEAGRASRSYVLITVLLASALFCGGTASKFEQNWVRRAVLAVGLAAFVFAAARLFLLPTQL